jgi:prophage antirepressor-like protein
MDNKIVVFQDKNIKRTWFNDEWWFCVSDIVEALTDSADVKQYIKKMRSRDEQLNSYWGTICTPLEMIARDGKKRKITCSNTENIFRIIQSVPSPKAD